MSLLTVEGLTKEFGGVRAVADVSFAVEKGTIHSVIGPNGAGKTTLFNLVTGVYTPTSGKVSLDGKDLTALSTSARAGLGMQRTFQNLQIFFNMSAIENVMAGRHLHLGTGLLASLLGLPKIRRETALARRRPPNLCAKWVWRSGSTPKRTRCPMAR